MGRTLGLLAFAAVLCISFRTPFEWGFFGHRLINRMAVFTLPPELIKIYKPHIEFVAAHAVDPDKRRYSTVHEAVRHYIDLDHWGHYPFDNLPRNWDKALIKFCDLTCVFANGDTVVLRGMDLDSTWSENQFYQPQYMQQFDRHTYQSFFRKHILPGYFEDPWEVPVDSFEIYFTLPTSPALRDISVQDTLSRTGILPYHLTSMQQQLTRAFVEKDLSKILRLSTDLGHYIGDAHVPLHTTTNYDGQLTNQQGIHAFWESRLPELFAEDTYDFFVGKANYINDPVEFYWNIVLQTNLLVDQVLDLENQLRNDYPSDQQYCFDERLDFTVRTQCREYAAAYHNLLAGQVEMQMRKSVLAVGSAWYSAWIDAGQPDLGSESTLIEFGMTETGSKAKLLKGKLGRRHE